MKIFNDIASWQTTRQQIATDKTLGVVMTMGALHKGHLSLIKQSQQDNDYTLVTIFVNPTQFNNQGDFDNYPNTWQQDVDLLTMEGVDFLLSPHKEMLYPDNYNYQINEKSLSQTLCGASRPGHFEGMLTIVMKLLNIARANNAYFGEKDYQQFQLIKGMADAFFIPTNIVSCPIIREEDELAFSSRNLRLDESARKKAGYFAQMIRQTHDIEQVKNALIANHITIDYLEDIDNRRFAAVIIDDVRLIDNFPLTEITKLTKENA
ncbi:pantoate--beta-alanine ligase [Cysteiniphilum sp. JM-1]|uniref:pantoate--beta-alanine ligase n=1 Tax=Cysteiniphilum sp. JM-1 TaxID=2610891 RepID=UPI001244BCF2|nr:pantoate--beta-alanine ligase [Cysteiniphilum sp. JM-1]